MSFREKSACVSLAAVVLVYGYYGYRLWGAPATRLGAIELLIGSTILMIIISVVGHLALAIHQRPEMLDERDVMVDLRSVRNGFHALAAGVWATIFLAVAVRNPIFLAYAALGAFVLAEAVRLISQLVYYRTGA